jgi:hypothetical protein
MQNLVHIHKPKRVWLAATFVTTLALLLCAAATGAHAAKTPTTVDSIGASPDPVFEGQRVELSARLLAIPKPKHFLPLPGRLVEVQVKWRPWRGDVFDAMNPGGRKS